MVLLECIQGAGKGQGGQKCFNGKSSCWVAGGCGTKKEMGEVRQRRKGQRAGRGNLSIWKEKGW